MCLITKENYRRTADEDLKVYKLLYPDDRSRFQSDYTYTKGMNRPFDLVPLPKPDRDGYLRITDGWLHAYTTLENAEFVCNVIKTWDDGNINIVEMTIPKGEDYFVDVTGRTVCAKKLYWDKIDD